MNDDPISHTEAQLTRWLDNAPGATPPENMNPRETARLRADAEAVAELLRKHVPTSVEPPYPDFFNSQVLKKIRDESSHEPAAAAGNSSPLWLALSAWLRSPWLVGGATAAIAVLAVATLRSPGGSGPETGTRVLSVFSPEPNATAHVLAGQDQGAVIVTVDGLEDFPGDRDVVGLLNDDSQTLVASHQP